MPVQTVTVKDYFYLQSGAPAAGAYITAKLDRWELATGEGYVGPKVVSTRADDEGYWELDLFPQADGSTASQYTITQRCGTEELEVTAVLPAAGPVWLHAIASLPPAGAGGAIPIPDAPRNGKLQGRKDNNWNEVTPDAIGLGNVDNTADLDKPISTAQQGALDAKVDKAAGMGLSSNDYTTTEKNKLASLNPLYVGTFVSLLQLQIAYPTASAGQYGIVDAGVGSDAAQYNWDASDQKWVASSNSAASTTDALPEGTHNLYFTPARAQAAQVQPDWNATSGVAQILNKPTIPAAIVYVAGKSGVASAVTGTTTSTIQNTCTIKGGTLGLNGRVRISAYWTSGGSGGSKVVEVWFGTIKIGTYNLGASGTAFGAIEVEVACRNSNTSKLSWYTQAMYGIQNSTSSIIYVPFTLDTSVDQDITFRVTPNNSGDICTLESYLVEYML